MAEKRTVLILALGRRYSYDRNGVLIGICTAGQRRAKIALERATCYATAYPSASIFLVASAGREARRTTGPTMASLTEKYWVAKEASFPMIVNTRVHQVWGTFAEIEWLLAQLKHIAVSADTIVLEVVAAPRQDTRIRLMLRWFFPHANINVVTSDEPPIPLYHEALGYLKLVAYMLGLRRVADWFRQVTARPIKE